MASKFVFVLVAVAIVAYITSAEAKPTDTTQSTSSTDQIKANIDSKLRDIKQFFTEGDGKQIGQFFNDLGESTKQLFSDVKNKLEETATNLQKSN